MLLTEYDEKKHMRMEREYGIELGIERERANTERERLNTEREKKRADYAEHRVTQLEAELRLLKEQIKK